MEYEYHVTGRVFITDVEYFRKWFSIPENRMLDMDGHRFSLSKTHYPTEDDSVEPGPATVMVSMPDIDDRKNVSDETVQKLARELSQKFGCKVFMNKGREDYGNDNVFNGGSDYEVVNEKWFLSVWEKGIELVSETTNHWNEKVEAMEEEYRNSPAALELGKFDL